MKLSELAERINGRLLGDGEVEISGAAPLTEAKPGEFSYLALSGYREQVMATRASAVIVVSEVEKCPCAQIVCEDPYLGFARAMRLMHPSMRPEPQISEQAVIIDAEIAEGCLIHPFVYIGKGVRIGKHCLIHPQVTIGDGVQIGDDCVIHSNVSIREESIIGDRVILQNGCRIGSDGYGFAKEPDGRHIKIPQVGRVVIEDDVEVGANCCIDRSTFSETRIGRGCKMDNLVQVGHNVTVGPDSLLVAQVGIAGSSSIGKGVTLAGQAGISGHLNIGDGATVGGKSGVTRDVEPYETVAGYPAIPYHRWKQLQRLLTAQLEQASRDDEMEE